MFCSNCNKENREKSKFCRFCGADLINKDTTKPYFKWVRFKLSRKYLVILGVLLFLGASVAYAFPKLNDEFIAQNAIGVAKGLQISGDFDHALSLLRVVEGKWMLGSTRQELKGLEAQENSYIKDKNNYNLAITESSSSAASLSDLENAQQLLQSISTDYPQYSEAQSALSGIQLQIESSLKNQTQQAQAEAQAASRAAAQAAQDKANAEIQTQAQAQAAAEAQAQAQAAAQAAAEAQAQARAQAQQQAMQRRQTAINQLQSIYNTFDNNGITDYNEGIDEFNAGLYLESMNYFSEAEATFKSVGDSITQMNNSYTNLDNDISSAMVTLSRAVVNCMDACLSMAETIGGTPNSASANLYINSCNSNKNIVAAFLSSQ